MTYASFGFSVIVAAFFAGECVAQQSDHVHELADKALPIIRQLNDERDQSRLLSDVAALLARNREQEFAYELFEEALVNDLDDDSLGFIGLNQFAAGFHEDALKKVAAMRQQNGWTRNQTLMLMVKRAAEQSEFEQTRQICGTINNDFWRSLAMAQWAVALFQRGDREQAKSMADKAIAGAKSSNDNDRSIPHLEYVIEELVEGGMKDFAQNIVAEVTPKATTEDDWRAIADMEGDCGNVEGVLRAVDAYSRWQEAETDAKIREINEGLKSVDLITVYANAGLIEMANEILPNVHDRDLHSTCAKRVFDSLVKLGRLDEAATMLPPIEATYKNPWVCASEWLYLAKVEFEKGDPESAKQLLQDLRERVQETKVPLPRHERYQDKFKELGKIHGELGFVTEFESYASSLQNPYAKATALIGLANGILNRAKNPK